MLDSRRAQLPSSAATSKKSPGPRARRFLPPPPMWPPSHACGLPTRPGHMHGRHPKSLQGRPAGKQSRRLPNPKRPPNETRSSAVPIGPSVFAGLVGLGCIAVHFYPSDAGNPTHVYFSLFRSPQTAYASAGAEKDSDPFCRAVLCSSRLPSAGAADESGLSAPVAGRGKDRLR
jgi:hypothetical protein